MTLQPLASCLGALALTSLAHAEVLHVDASAVGANDGSSWTNAFPALQDALANAKAGDEIWVRVGTYHPDQGAAQLTGDRDASFALISGVALYGGFDGTETSLAQRAGLYAQTILSGDLDEDDHLFGKTENSRHVVRATSVDASARLDGFTIVAGNANGPDARGAGLLAQGGGPTLDQCSFTNNRAEESGAGVQLEDCDARLTRCTLTLNLAERPGAGSFARGGGMAIEGGLPVLESCEFSSNMATIEMGNGSAQGGGLYVTNSALQMSECAFESNAAKLTEGSGFGQGGALYLDQDSDAVLVGCSFLGNLATSRDLAEGGAVSARFGSSPSFLSCTFAGNQATAVGSGGAVHLREDCDASFVDCSFSGNSATSQGGALFAWDELSAPALTNCTLSANNADLSGGGMFLREASPAQLVSSVLWSNSDAGGSDESAQIDGGLPAVRYSCVQGLTGALGGPGNIGLDPLFVDPDGEDDKSGTLDDDLRLSMGSPCIDAGDTLSVPADAFDLDQDGDLSEPTPLDLAAGARLLDDPKVADSGTGVAPVVDMGPLERAPATLSGDVTSFSLQTGGSQVLSLDAGPLFAGYSYVVLGTISGTTPGLTFGGFTIPLNADDYTSGIILNPGAPPLSGALGLLDGAGRTSATFTAPAGLPPGLLGTTFHHALLAFELTPTLLELRHVSNPVALTVSP